MKMFNIGLLIGLIVSGILGGIAFYRMSMENHQLRQIAERLSGVQIVDGTRPIERAIISSAGLTGVYVGYGPYPVLTVEEWADGGFIGHGKTPSRMQWSCPPGYTLKFDGSIPYCEPEP